MTLRNRRQSSLNRRAFLGVGFASLASGCAISPSPVAAPAQPLLRLPFHHDYGRRLIVQVSVNERGPYEFIVDTAATRSVIFENLTNEIDVTPLDKPPASVFGLSGIRQAPIYDAGHINIGDLSLSASEAPLLPDWREATRTPQGILGLDFLLQYSFFIRQDTRQIEFYEGAPPLDADWVRAEIIRNNFGSVERALLLTEVNFGVGRRVSFLLDTGSTISACNFPAANLLRTIPARSRQRQTNDFVDVHGGKIETYALNADVFRIGGAHISNQALVITDAQFFDQIGYRDKPLGVLGLDFFRRRNMAFNIARNEFAFPAPVV